jgi:ribosomal protein S18 acetylase RimI-like enzyme
MEIRPASVRDLNACLAIDDGFETDYVWQMEEQRGNGTLTVHFRTARLPRPLRVPATLDRDWLFENFERGECFRVAVDERDQVRGLLDVTTRAWNQTAALNHLIVAPAFRRRGLGSQLLAAGIEWAREQGWRVMMVETQTKNYPAISFYQKQGFVFCGFNDQYYTNRDIAVFFALKLR